MNRPVWWKGKFALFQMPQVRVWREGGRHLSKGRLPPPTNATSGARAFIDRVGAGELHAETAQSSLTVIFKPVISIILVVLGPVHLQFQGPVVPISLGPILRILADHALGTV